MNSIKFKKFEDLNIGPITDLYRKNLLIDNNNKIELNNDNNIINRKTVRSLLEKKIDAVNKSMNSPVVLLQDQKNKVDEKSEVMELKEKANCLGKDIELEVIDDKQNV